MTIASDINAIPPNPDTLRLIHTTSVASLRSFCQTGLLSPQYCNVMKTDLTYFFYGRPAYRPGKINLTNKDKDSRPVCLLFDKKSVPSRVGVYPCDTGAQLRNYYSPFLDGVSISDLYCITIGEAEGRIVSRYFGKNDDYFYGQELSTLIPAPISSVAVAFHNLLTSNRASACDDRSRSLDVTQNVDFSLHTCLRSVFLPDFLAADAVVKPVVTDWEQVGIQVIFYRPQNQTSAGMAVEQLFPDVGKLQGLVA